MNRKSFMYLLSGYVIVQCILIYLSQTFKELNEPYHLLIIGDIIITAFWLFSIYFINTYYQQPQTEKTK